MRYQRICLLVSTLLLSLSLHTYGQYEIYGKDTTETNPRLKNIAYGIQEESKIVGSINTIYAEELQNTNAATLSEALIAKLPGLTVLRSSGEPGTEANLYIRGRNTYGNTTPLYIVDGFRVQSINFLSIYMIESVSVLKDALALSLYGQEGANGAILVTTKRGNNQKTQINFNFNTGFQNPASTPDLLDAQEYAMLYNQALQNDGLDPLYTEEEIPLFGKGGDASYLYPNIDYFDEFIKDFAPLTQGNLNINGGGEDVRYFFGMGYQHQGGIYKYTDENPTYSTQQNDYRYNIVANIDVELSRRLSAQIDVAGRISQSSTPGMGPGQDNAEVADASEEIFSTLYKTPSLAHPIFNPDGSIGGTGSYTKNPYGLISQQGRREFTFRDMDSRLRLNYDFEGVLSGLRMSIAGAVSDNMVIWDSKIRAGFPIYDITEYTADTVIYQLYNDEENLSWKTGGRSNQRMNFEANASYIKSFGEHHVNALLMYHMDQYETVESNYSFRNLGMGFRTHYSYANKYLAEVAVSYYGQEQYAAGNRFGLFPSFGAGWILSNEDFLKDNSTVSFLKIRASHGMVGGAMAFTGTNLNNRIYFNQYYSGASPVKFGPNNTTAFSGRIESRLANPNITWDKSYKTDISLEAELFKSLTIYFNYFRDLRTDILTLDGQIPGALGVSNNREPYTNSGEVLNKGYESYLVFRKQSGSFSYNVNAGLWYARNKLIANPNTIIYEYEHANAIGKPVGQIFGLESIGYYESDEAAANSEYVAAFGDVGAGDAMYKNQTGDDKVIDDYDKIALGYNALPEYTFSLGLDLRYRKAYFSAMIDGTKNGTIMPLGFYVPFTGQGNAFAYAADAWTEDATNPSYPRLSTISNTNNTKPSDIWLRSTDYLKLRSVEIGYDVKTATQEDHQSFRVYLRGMNLFTLAKDFDFADVESKMSYPVMRSLSLGVIANF